MRKKNTTLEPDDDDKKKRTKKRDEPVFPRITSSSSNPQEYEMISLKTRRGNYVDNTDLFVLLKTQTYRHKLLFLIEELFYEGASRQTGRLQ